MSQQPVTPMVKPGDKFGQWTAGALVRDGGRWYVDCVCDCGVRKRVRWYRLSRGESISCGCFQRIDQPQLSGQKFGRWTAGESFRRPGKWMIQCTCECGVRKFVRYDHLRTGLTTSCGCYGREQVTKANTKHGECRKSHGNKPTPEFATWVSMRQRCTDPANESYPSYGGRGISVCEEWMNSYPAFLAHVGRKPTPEHTIERIDNNGNYEPGNVRWATRVEQCNNRRSNHFLEWNGKSQTMAQWGREIGIDPLTLSARLSRGWSAEKTLTTPLR